MVSVEDFDDAVHPTFLESLTANLVEQLFLLVTNLGKSFGCEFRFEVGFDLFGQFGQLGGIEIGIFFLEACNGVFFGLEVLDGFEGVIAEIDVGGKNRVKQLAVLKVSLNQWPFDVANVSGAAEGVGRGEEHDDFCAFERVLNFVIPDAANFELFFIAPGVSAGVTFQSVEME